MTEIKFDPVLVEAVRLAICRARFDCNNHPCDGDDTGRCKAGSCRKPMSWQDEAHSVLLSLAARGE